MSFRLIKELEKYRPRGNSFFETMSRGFLRETLSGLSLYVLGSVCLVFAFKKFTDEFKYGVVNVMKNVGACSIKITYKTKTYLISFNFSELLKQLWQQPNTTKCLKLFFYTRWQKTVWTTAADILYWQYC